MVSFCSMIKFRFRKKEELYFFLKKILGFAPSNLDFYREALMHKSLSVRDEDGKIVNNERLEFLGDAIIEAVVSDIVYRRFNRAHEGFLTTTRSKMVQRSALNNLAAKIGLDELVRFTRRTEAHNSYIGGNAFEALVGAVYLDKGYKRSFGFIKHLIDEGFINPESTAKKEQNFKSRLLEYCQKNKLEAEFVSFENAEALNTNEPLFTSYVFVEDCSIGLGQGFSKKESHQKAARNAVEKIRRSTHLKTDLQLYRLQRLVTADVLISLSSTLQLMDGTED